MRLQNNPIINQPNNRTKFTVQQIILGTFFQSVYFQCLVLHCILTFSPNSGAVFKSAMFIFIFPPLVK